MKGKVITCSVSSEKSMKKKKKDYGVMNEGFLKNNEDFGNKIQFALTVKAQTQV